MEDFRLAFPLAKLFRQQAPMLREIALAQRKSRRIWSDVVKILPRLSKSKPEAGTAGAEEARPTKRQKLTHK